MKRLLFSILFLITGIRAGYAQDTKYYPVSPEIKFVDVPDRPKQLGDFFVFTYKVMGDIGENGLTFPENTEGFGFPVLVHRPDRGRLFQKTEWGEGYYTGDIYEFTYAFFPTQTGRLALPRASIRMNGEMHTIKEKFVEVLPPASGKLKDLKVQLIAPDVIKAIQEFNLTVILEGDCTKEDQFALITSVATPWTIPGNKNKDPRVYYPKGKKENGKHIYQVPMIINEPGTYDIPDLYLRNETDGTYFPAGLVEMVVKGKKKKSYAPVLTTFLPDMVWVGKPFTIVHQLKGEMKKPGQLVYQKDTSAGLNWLDEPIFENVGKKGKVETYHLIDELVAAQEGEVIIPSLKVSFDNYRKYIIDPVVIQAIQPSVPFYREMSVKTDVPEIALMDDKFWLIHRVNGFSGDLYSMNMHEQAYEYMLSENFVIEKRLHTKNKRFTIPHESDEYNVISYDMYIWVLRPKRTGDLKIAPLQVSLNGNVYSGSEKKILVKEQLTSEDVEIYIPKVAEVNSEISLVIRTTDKERWFTEVLIEESAVYEVEPQEAYVEKEKTVRITPLRTGIIEIPVFIVRTEQGDITCGPLTLEVVPEDTGTTMSAGSVIHPSDVVSQMTLSKEKVYPNQPFMVYHTLYSRLEEDDSDAFYTFNWGDFELNGSFEGISNRRLNYFSYKDKERINDLVYDVNEGNKYLVSYPEPGKPVMPKVEYTTEFKVNNKLVTYTSGWMDIPQVEVIPFPEKDKPDSFHGLVGTFSMETILSAPEKEETREKLLIVYIRGERSVELLEEYPVDITLERDNFRLEKIQDQTNMDYYVSEKGFTGYRRIAYKVIPKQSGTLIIPSIVLSWFDPEKEQYMTAESGDITFEIE